MTRILTDKPLRREMSEKARRSAEKAFDAQLQAQRYVELYEEVVNHSDSPAGKESR
jgi:glycosyltransferase involved in cell wall biosynthesis